MRNATTASRINAGPIRRIAAMTARHHRRSLAGLFAAGGMLVALGLTGCQSDIGGQTLPSPSYMLDDVQYFAPGPEFKLSREAAAQKAFAADAEFVP
jgi:hypothetical protein